MGTYKKGVQRGSARFRTDYKGSCMRRENGDAVQRGLAENYTNSVWPELTKTFSKGEEVS